MKCKGIQLLVSHGSEIVIGYPDRLYCHSNRLIIDPFSSKLASRPTHLLQRLN